MLYPKPSFSGNKYGLHWNVVHEHRTPIPKYLLPLIVSVVVQLVHNRGGYLYSPIPLLYCLLSLVHFLEVHLHWHCDKIRSYYVQWKDTKDTVGRYIVLILEVKVDSCQHDSE